MFSSASLSKKLASLALVWLCSPVFAEITPRAPYVVTPDAAAVEGGPPAVANPRENPGSWRPVMLAPGPLETLRSSQDAALAEAAAASSPQPLTEADAENAVLTTAPATEKPRGSVRTWLTVNPDTGLVSAESEPIEEMSEERAASRQKVVERTPRERPFEFAETSLSTGSETGSVTEYLQENRYPLLALVCLLLAGYWGARAFARLSAIKPKRRRRRKSRSTGTSSSATALAIPGANATISAELKVEEPTTEGRRRSKNRSRHHSSSRSGRQRGQPSDPAAGTGVG